jgi:hypothetical protein
MINMSRTNSQQKNFVDAGGDEDADSMLLLK